MCAEEVGERTIQTHNPKVSLVRKTNQVSEDAGLLAAALNLAQDDVTSVEGGRNGGQVALFAGKPQDRCIADDVEAASAGRSELFDESVGEAVTEAGDCGIAGFVVEA